jgi:hypothetical protein
MTLAKITRGALGALVALAILVPVTLSTPVAAAAAAVAPPAPSSTPPDNGNPNGSGGDGGDIPPPQPEQQIVKIEETCNAALAQLVRIPEKTVAAFDNAGGVDVAPVCNSGLGHQARIDASQALPLQNAIKHNPVLMAALKARGFNAEDVVGVVMVGGVATLYVHKGAKA